MPIKPAVFLITAAIGLAAATAFAGELDPPAGPVSPTMKDLDDVEPRTVLRNDFDTLTPIQITQPGSYKLGENILALPGQNAITISASNVTLDLNGFEVRGNNEVGSINGVFINGDQVAVTIRNGTLHGFFEFGIRGEFADTVHVEYVKMNFNSFGGMVVRFGAVVTGCSARNNSGFGFSAGGNAVFTDCVAQDNGGDGIIMGGASAGRGLTAYLNGGDGIRIGSASTLTNSTAFQNGATGIVASQHCSVSDCTSTDNTEHGFTSTNACTFLNCVASINGMDGFRTTQSVVRGCLAITNGGTGYNDIVGTVYFENY